MADASRDIITRQVSTTMGRLHVSDHAGDEPALVGQLILLNTYYGRAPALRLPEMISLLADAMLNDPDQRMWLLGHTARQFGGDPLDPDSVAVAAIVPQFFGEAGRLDALPAIRAWTAALACDLDAQDNWPAWTFPSAWSSARWTATSPPTWPPTSPACSPRPTPTWWTARPTGRNATGPRPSRS